MSIGIRCLACAREYHVNPRLAGKRVKCKACGAAIRVPAASTDAGAEGAAEAPAGPVLRPTSSTPAAGKDFKNSSATRSPQTKPAPAVPGTNAIAAHIANAVAADSAARPAEAKSSELESHGLNPAPPGGAMRRVYQLIAVIVVLGFVGLVYIVGREAGIWGEPGRSRSTIARVLTPEQQLARNRYLSQANLIRLGLALDLWAKGHRGMYPARLDAVNEVAELTPDVFHSPFINEQTPAALRDSSYQYLYSRSMGVALHHATVLAYDAVELAAGEGANVLYGSGEVKWIRSEALAGEIARSEARRLGLAAPANSEPDADKLASRPADRSKPAKHRRD